MDKYKIGICGHFGGNNDFADGQTIKTKILYEELVTVLGEKNIRKVDTFRWTRRINTLLLECLELSKRCNHIIIILSNKGRNVFLPFFYIMKIIFKCNVHCMVIGGGFPIQMKSNIIVNYFAKKIDGIYVETNWMMNELKKMEYKNINLLNNFKRLNIISRYDLDSNHTEPFKICTFSRVCKEKGIEDIIDAVKYINEKNDKVIFKLDIYGQIEKDYISRFEDIRRGFPKYVSYKGVIQYDKSVETINKYFMLAFPTKYRTEGVPGTIIDAYAAGVPVIASRWDSCNDVIEENKTGIFYDFNNKSDLIKKMEEISINPDMISNMKKNCINKANEYLVDNVIKDFINKLKL